jgi:hypothetical protein
MRVNQTKQEKADFRRRVPVKDAREDKRCIDRHKIDCANRIRSSCMGNSSRNHLLNGIFLKPNDVIEREKRNYEKIDEIEKNLGELVFKVKQDLEYFKMRNMETEVKLAFGKTPQDKERLPDNTWKVGRLKHKYVKKYESKRGNYTEPGQSCVKKIIIRKKKGCKKLDRLRRRKKKAYDEIVGLLSQRKLEPRDEKTKTMRDYLGDKKSVFTHLEIGVSITEEELAAINLNTKKGSKHKNSTYLYPQKMNKKATEEIEQRLTKLESKQGKLANKVEAVENRLTKVEDALGGLKLSIDEGIREINMNIATGQERALELMDKKLIYSSRTRDNTAVSKDNNKKTYMIRDKKLIGNFLTGKEKFVRKEYKVLYIKGFGNDNDVEKDMWTDFFEIGRSDIVQIKAMSEDTKEMIVNIQVLDKIKKEIAEKLGELTIITEKQAVYDLLQARSMNVLCGELEEISRLWKLQSVKREMIKIKEIIESGVVAQIMTRCVYEEEAAEKTESGKRAKKEKGAIPGSNLK